jgi:hypothetical protein
MAVALSAVAQLGLFGCDDGFDDRISSVDGLRVLAVQSDAPYAAPGTRPTLSMLVHDGPARPGRPETKRDIKTLWLGACVNPPGDLYSACFSTLRDSLRDVTDDALATQTVPSGVPEGTLGFGTEFEVVVPPSIIANHGRPDGVAHPYGLVMVFFAACAGELRLVRDGDPARDYPVACFRPGTNDALGQDSFEFGYYPLYVYDDLTNENPLISSASFHGFAEGGSCADDADCGGGYACGRGSRCLPIVGRCTASKVDDCPSFEFDVSVADGSVEPAVSAYQPLGSAALETLWLSFYADGGDFEKDTKLVHDPKASAVISAGSGARGPMPTQRSGSSRSCATTAAAWTSSTETCW